MFFQISVGTTNRVESRNKANTAFAENRPPVLGEMGAPLALAILRLASVILRLALSFHVNAQGTTHVNMRKSGTACFRCVDARETIFHVTVFHLRSGQGNMKTPGRYKRDKDIFKKNVLSQVFRNIYNNAEALAADIKVLVGDFNMETEVISDASSP